MQCVQLLHGRILPGAGAGDMGELQRKIKENQRELQETAVKLSTKTAFMKAFGEIVIQDVHQMFKDHNDNVRDRAMMASRLASVLRNNIKHYYSYSIYNW